MTPNTPILDLAIDERELRSIAHTVRAQVPGITHDDAEDAVQEAWIVLAQKAHTLEPGPVGGFLMRTAKFKAMQIRDRQRRATSLDAMTEEWGDSTSALLDDHALDPSIHAEVSILEQDPIAAQRLQAARAGAAAQVAPRGAAHRAARYTDEQVHEVRRLHRIGVKLAEIARKTGVPAGYCSQIARGKTRLLDSTEGWTRDKVITAIRSFHERHGRAPRQRDLVGDVTMPCATTMHRMFGSMSGAIREAGLVPAYDRRRMTTWSHGELVLALCGWRIEHGRWPTGGDMARDDALPSPATAGRKLGTRGAAGVAERILELLR